MYISIDKDTIKEVQETIISLKPLRARLVEIKSELEEVEKEPDEILMSNTNKLTRIDDLKKEQTGIKELLK